MVVGMLGDAWFMFMLGDVVAVVSVFVDIGGVALK